MSRSITHVADPEPIWKFYVDEYDSNTGAIVGTYLLNCADGTIIVDPPNMRRNKETGQPVKKGFGSVVLGRRHPSIFHNESANDPSTMKRSVIVELAPMLQTVLAEELALAHPAVKMAAKLMVRRTVWLSYLREGEKKNLIDKISIKHCEEWHGEMRIDSEQTGHCVTTYVANEKYFKNTSSTAPGIDCQFSITSICWEHYCLSVAAVTHSMQATVPRAAAEAEIVKHLVKHIGYKPGRGRRLSLYAMVGEMLPKLEAQFFAD